MTRWILDPNYSEAMKKVGDLGVDSASVKITIGDGAVPEQIDFWTPEGDGRYSIWAGTDPSYGQCIVISFRRERHEA